MKNKPLFIIAGNQPDFLKYCFNHNLIPKDQINVTSLNDFRGFKNVTIIITKFGKLNNPIYKYENPSKIEMILAYTKGEFVT